MKTTQSIVPNTNHLKLLIRNLLPFLLLTATQQFFPPSGLNQSLVFSFFLDQEEADIKAADNREVRKGQETARAEEVWQKGWYFIFTTSLYCKLL